MIEYGSDAGRGNLLGVQPFMTAADYVSQAAFRAKLDSYMGAAAKKGWLNARTIVVWPEHLGTWLVSADERAAVSTAPDIQAALRALLFRHTLPFIRGFLTAHEKDKTAASLFRLKAGQMTEIYNSVFSQLAKKYAVTIVAGSILLPAPHVLNGVVSPGSGPLYNVSAVYRPDGAAEPTLVRKTVPTTGELPFVMPAPVSELPIFDTPAGRLGVLICADSWYTAPYERLKNQAAELIAVPSCITEQGMWNMPWKGYDGAAAPADVELHDIGTITEGQAWRKYALAPRMLQGGVRYGINVFLRGSLWDLGMDGNSMLAVDGSLRAEASRGESAILNLWL